MYLSRIFGSVDSLLTSKPAKLKEAWQKCGKYRSLYLRGGVGVLIKVLVIFSCGLFRIDQGFSGGFRAIISIAFSVELHSVIFSASSRMTDATVTCVSPCNPMSTIAQSTLLLRNLTCGTFNTSSTSPFFYILTITTSNTTSGTAL